MATYNPGVDYDITMTTAAGVEYGFMLADGEDGKPIWTVSENPFFSQRMDSGESGARDIPPEREKIWRTGDWTGGCGAETWRPGVNNRYHEAHDVDPRHEDQVVLAPLITEVVVKDANPAANSTMGVMRGRRSFWRDGAILQMTARDSNGYQPIAEFYGGEVEVNVTKNRGTGQAQCGGIPYGAYSVCFGPAYYWYGTPGGSTWTEKGPFTEIVDMVVCRDLIWMAGGNKVYSTDDVTDANSWTEYTIGDSHGEIQALMVLDNEVLVCKSDGIFSFDRYEARNLTPEFAQQSHTDNFRTSCVFHNDGYFSVLHDTLLRYHYGYLSDVSPAKAAPHTTIRDAHVVGLAAGYDWLYAAVVTSSGATSNIVLLAGQEQGNRFAWHQLREFTVGDRIQMDGVGGTYNYDYPIYFDSRHLTTSTSSLWMGSVDTASSGVVGYMLLSGHGPPQDDTNCKYVSTGYLLSSWWDGDFPMIDKSFRSVEIRAEGDMSANIKITVSFKADTDSSWTSLGDVIATGWTTKSFATTATGKRIQLKLQLTTNDSSKTPVLKEVILHSILRPTAKSRFEFGVRCADKLPLLNSSHSSYTSSDIYTNLETLRDETSPITLTDCDTSYTVTINSPLQLKWAGKEHRKNSERLYLVKAEEAV